MSKILKFIPKVINGLIFASYEMDGQIYRAEPIKQKQDIVISKITGGQVVRLDLAGQLKYDLLVTSVDVDLEFDDGKVLQFDPNGNVTSTYIQIIVDVLDRQTGKNIKSIPFQLSSTKGYETQIIISPDYIYDILTNQNINSITLTGEPIYKPQPIVVVAQPRDT